MSDNPTGTQEMTAPDLAALVGSAVKEAIEPLTKRTGDVASLLEKSVAQSEPEVKVDLGPYPVGRKLRALALGQNDPHRAKAEVIKNWGINDPAVKWLDAQIKSLSANNATAAGDMVFPTYDPEWIALLRNNAVVRGTPGVRTIPMPRGAMSIRQQLTAATAYYIAENDNITPSNQTVGRKNLSYKKLTALTVVSNDLLRFAGTEADQFVQDDLLQVAALKEDGAFLMGNPPADAAFPQGIRYQTAAANVFAAGGTALSNYQADLTKAVRLVQEANVPAAPGNSFWYMSPGQFWAIYALATTSGDWVFAQELSAGRLLGFGVRITTQLTPGAGVIAVGAGTNGLIMFAHAPSLIIADSMQRSIAAYPGGAYYDNTAAAVLSGISRDETVFVQISEHDFCQKYDKAVAIITGYAS
jgi:HK97 family phage major capsid protein